MDSSETTRCPPDYIKTLQGIFKCVELVLCLLTFACSLGGNWSPWGGGWVEFVATSSFITTVIWFILHLLLNRLPRILVNVPVEFITYCVMAGLYLIAGIVAAARAPYLTGAVAATAFFALAATIVYAVDTFIQFRDWRSSDIHMTTTTAGASSGSHAPSDIKVQY